MNTNSNPYNQSHQMGLPMMSLQGMMPSPTTNSVRGKVYGVRSMNVASPLTLRQERTLPNWPMLMLFAAYGIQMAKTNPRMRKWFLIALAIEVVACLAWNWFKLKGRGMI